MPNVLILGGGYAGVAAARFLARYAPGSWSATLVDARPTHQLLTRLPEIVGGRLAPSQAEIPLSFLLEPAVRFIPATIERIDVHERVVQTTAGPLQFDWLVLALGAVPGPVASVEDLSGVYPVRSVEAAVALRQGIGAAQLDSSLLRIAIVGGGYTGTEIAAELAEWKEPGGKLHVVLLAEEPRLLGQGNARLAAVAAARLRARGVELLLEASVERVCAGGLQLAGGMSLAADLIIWATPSCGAPVARTLGAQTRSDARIQVDPWLRVPDIAGVYAAGDVAAAFDYVHERAAPSSAQLAIQAGETAAANILADALGDRPREFRPRSIGEALSLGSHDGVAEVLGVVVTGRKALAVKEAALGRYLFRLGGTELVQRYLRASGPKVSP